MSKILGFSCVENHVLDFLHSRCENFGLLYFDCFMPLNQIYKAAQKRSFEYFSEVQKIQDVFKNNSLLDIDLYTTDFSNFIDHLQGADNNTQILMLMRAENSQLIFCARGLREDHYVVVSMKNDIVVLTNDIPNKKISLSKSEVGDLYANNFLELRYQSFYNIKQLTDFEKQRKYPILTTSNGIKFSAVEDDNFLVSFRNTLVIMKTMRERLSEYLSAKNYTFNITDEVCEISKLVAQTEYIRLRKIFDKKKYLELVVRLNEIDSKIFNKIKGVFFECQK